MKAVIGFLVSFGESVVRYSETACAKVTTLFQAAHAQAQAFAGALNTRHVKYLAAGTAAPVIGVALLVCSIVPPILTSVVLVGIVATDLLLFEAYHNFNPPYAQPPPPPPPPPP